MKLLIVDDHQEVRNFIREMATPLASEIRECTDGLEAVRVYSEFEPDFVVMDLQMPELDGFEATRRILEKHPGARIIAVSHLQHPDVAEFARRVGARTFVAKDNLSGLARYLSVESRAIRQ